MIMLYAFAPAGALEEKYAIRVLLALYHEGTMVKGDLYPLVASGKGTVHDRISGLIALGLIAEEQERAPPWRKRITLTERGLQVAELLDRADMLLDTECASAL